MGLKNRVGVITGATGDLGRVVARVLADKGVRLGLVSTNQNRLEALGRELDLPSGRWLAHAADLTAADGAQAAADAVIAEFGRLDILVHLVGGWTGGVTALETPVEDMVSMVQQHLWTTFHVTQAFVPHLVANGWGRVMAVSSPVASRPGGKSAPYAAGKAAQEAFLLALAQDLKGSGVTANLLLVRTIDGRSREDSDLTPEASKWTTPDEIASAILYLGSDAAGVVNGARIPLYGTP